MAIGFLVVALVAVAIVIWIGVNQQARRIVRRRADDLARATGMPADQIEREIRELKITPGQWAALHGLDPYTFEPR